MDPKKATSENTAMIIPTNPRILIVEDKRDERFLRQKTKEFPFDAWTLRDIRTLIKTMRGALTAARGVGLSANQIGLDLRVFVAHVEHKFYAVFNPRIIETERERMPLEEGCLSVPGRYGMVPRAHTLTLTGMNQNQRRIKLKAWGLLAHIIQHELDHLNGILFTDKATGLKETPISERLKARNEQPEKGKQ